jgi:hypothetical protein
LPSNVTAPPDELIEVQLDETKIHSVGSKTASKPEIIQWAVDLHPAVPWLREHKNLMGYY